MSKRPQNPLAILFLTVSSGVCFTLVFVMLFSGFENAPWRLWVALAAQLTCAAIQIYLFRDLWVMLWRGKFGPPFFKAPSETPAATPDSP